MEKISYIVNKDEKTIEKVVEIVNERNRPIKYPGRWPTNTWFQNRLKKVRNGSNGE